MGRAVAAADVLAGEESPDSKGCVLVNGQRGRPQGKCHRKHTAELRSKGRGGKGEKVR